MFEFKSICLHPKTIILIVFLSLFSNALSLAQEEDLEGTSQNSGSLETFTPLPPIATGVTIPNVRIFAGTPQSHPAETAVALNPSDATKIVAAYIQYVSGNPGANTIGYSYSNDTGRTWTNGLFPNSPYVNAGDPTLTYDANGNVWFAHMQFDKPTTRDVGGYYDNGLFVDKSSNNGASWLTTKYTIRKNGNGGSDTVQSHFEDQPIITCDNDSRSPYFGSVYLIWDSWTGGSYSAQVSFSKLVAGDAQFSEPVIVSLGDPQKTQSPQIAVGKSGQILVAWKNGLQDFIITRSSTDGGMNFGPQQSNFAGFATSVSASTLNKCRPPEAGGDCIRAVTYPAICGDATGGRYDGSFYMVWAGFRDGVNRIWFSKKPLGGDWINPKQVAPISSGQQWSPSISLSSNGTISVMYYDSRHDPNDIMTDVYVSTSVDGGESFTETQVNSYSFDPRPPIGTFLGDYNTMRMSNTRAFPIWSDNRNLHLDIFTALLDYQPVTVSQMSSTNIPIGTFGRWNGSSFGAQRFNPPQPFSFLASGTEVFDPQMNPISNPPGVEKYHHWNADLSNVINHQVFSMSPAPTEIISHTMPLSTGSQIRNQVIDAPLYEGGTIDFQDPWLVDIQDTQFYQSPFGYRNLGKDLAVYKAEQSTPFRPDTSSKYHGIFLNENSPNLPTRPIYKIRTTSIKDVGIFLNSKFLNWEATGAQVINPSSVESPVVFLSNDNTISARYKVNMATSNSLALSYNSQRKVVVAPSDVPGGADKHYFVYESANAIWSTTRTNGGTTWDYETNVSSFPPSNTSYRNPTIEVPGYAFASPVIAWESIDNVFNHSIMTNLSAPFKTLASFSTSSDQLALPVITSVDYFGNNHEYREFTFFWRDGSGISWFDIPDYSASTSYSGSIGVTTSSSSNFSAVSYYQNNTTNYCTVWQEGTSTPRSIKYSLGSWAPGYVLNWSSPVNVSASLSGDNTSPSIVLDDNGLPCVTWVNTNSGVSKIEFRALNLNGSEISGYNSEFSTCISTAASLPVLSNHRYDGSATSSLTLTWQQGSYSFAAQRTGVPGTWSTPIVLSTTGQAITLNDSKIASSQRYGVISSQGPNLSTLQSIPIPAAPSLPPATSLTSPTDYTTGASSRPTLSWSCLLGADSYHIKVLQPDGGVAAEQDGITSTSYRLTEPLVSGTTYTWQVVAHNSSGEGAWSTVWHFTTNPPSGLNAPHLNGSNYQNHPSLSWNATSINYGLYRYICPNPPGGAPLDCQDYPHQTQIYYGSGLSFIDYGVVIGDKNSTNQIEYYVVAYNGSGQSSALSNKIMCYENFVQKGTGDYEMADMSITETSLLPNYPNPFNPSTKFSYTLAQPGRASLVIYNMLGQRIATLVDGVLDMGYYSTTWDAGSSPTGLYYARMIITDLKGDEIYRDTRKVLLLK